MSSRTSAAVAALVTLLGCQGCLRVGFGPTAAASDGAADSLLPAGDGAMDSSLPASDGAAPHAEIGVDGPPLDSGPPAGSTIFATGLGGPDSDSVKAAAIDAQGNLYMLWRLGGSVMLGQTTYTNTGRSDLFVVSYDAALAFRWARQLKDLSVAGGIIIEGRHGIAVDGLGHVVVVGEFAGTMDYGDGPVTSAGGDDVLIVNLAADSGSYHWGTHFGSSSAELAGGVAVDSAGNVYVTGGLAGAATIGTRQVSNSGGTTSSSPASRRRARSAGPNPTAVPTTSIATASRQALITL